MDITVFSHLFGANQLVNLSSFINKIKM